jgi:predicted deacylase
MSTIERRERVRFDLESVAAGTHEVRWLDVCPLPDGTMLRLPLLIARGARPGRTLVVLGGIHGDEYEGPAAAREVFDRLDPAAMAGTYLAVPVCNPPAFAAQTRCSPLDGQNLARVFPGDPNGTVSERIAHAITTEVTSRADFLIDLHSSGSFMAMPLLAGYPMGGHPAARLAREAARCFGLPVIWGHEGASEGRSLSEPHARGVPWLYTESPSGGWLHADIAHRYAEGVRRVMQLLGILEGAPPRARVEHDLAGEGDVDRSLTAPTDGFLVNAAELLQSVRQGDLLGTICDLAGEPLAEIRAPSSGILMLRREAASVHAGDLLYLLT